MKYLVTILAAAMMLFLPYAVVSAQTFNQCADVDMSGSLDLADLSRMISSFLGGPAVPPGRGDVDFRQGYNLGDLRYFSGYLFLGYPPGGCPPFPGYTLVNTADSLFLPEVPVPSGSGSLLLPIVLANKEPISDLLITARLSSVNCDASLDSVSQTNWPIQIANDHVMSNDLSLIWSSVSTLDPLQPGTRTIAVLHISYSASSGGTVTLSPDTFGENRFIHEVFGNLAIESYTTMSIGVPQVIVGPAPVVPTMTVTPDSLYFVALSGSGNPDAQTFEILSDGGLFDWSATAPFWISLTPTAGISGATVSVQPLANIMSPGTHIGTIVVTSLNAFASPQNVKVVLKIQPQFPSFDANCDGTFNVSDIVVLIMYVFGGPAPCDPCGL